MRRLFSPSSRLWRRVGYVGFFALGCGATLLALRLAGRDSAYAPQGGPLGVLAAIDRAPSPAHIPQTALIAAAARIEPAVVNIDTLEERGAPSVTRDGLRTERLQVQGKGSGVLISSDGYIVTNSHVVEHASIIRVTVKGGRQFDGRVIGADPQADIAVVKVDGSGLPSAELGDSDALRVGEFVLAVGNPLGIGTTVTHGIVSATNRRNLAVGSGRILRQALQTDAPITQGNSGGALANLRGQLVGINTAIASDRGGAPLGIGFAIPVNPTRSVLRRLIAVSRTTPRAIGDPFIGISFARVPRDVSREVGLPPGRGIIVLDVKPLTGAADAGLEVGSIIVAIDGRPIAAEDDVRQALAPHQPGQTVAVRIFRGDRTEREVMVRLGRRPEAPPSP
ncbi:MAG TPA: trypsin-like peptidase domain-containing protein [Chthonomonadales bacterium]|nr:trypsin-like peptidase domain-containing protein [Chthonomonadales bacterium]